jgi:hypothetical protein
MKIIQETDVMGNIYEVVVIENQDGSVTSMFKSHYEELEAAKEVKADEAKTK